MTRKLRQSLLCLLLLLACLPPAHAEDFETTATPDDLYTYIQELYERNYNDTLLEKTELFLQLYPAHRYADPVRQIQIATLNQQKRLPETVAAIHKYLEQNPSSSQREAYRTLEAACRFNLKDYAGAADCYHELMEQAKNAKDREDATLALATCLTEMQKEIDALKLLQSLVALPLEKGLPARLQARVEYLKTLQKEGNLREALRLSQEMLDFPEISAALRQPLLCQAANFAYLLGEDLELADRLYTAYLVEFPQGSAALPALRQLCVCKFRLKKYDDFLELASRYRSQLPTGSDDPQMDLDTVEALMSLQRFQEALPFARKIIAAPQITQEVLRKARYNEFVALANLQQDDEVLSKGASFLEDYPNFPYKTAILSQLVITSAKDDARREQTRTYLETLLPLVAGDTAATLQYGFLLAQLYEKDNLWSRAADLLEETARQNSAQRSALLMRAAQDAGLASDFPRAQKLLAPLRDSSQSPQGTVLQASEILFQLSTRANQTDVAIQTARETVDAAQGREKTVWLTRLANLLLQENQLETAANCYGLALATPELPEEARRGILPTQVQLLLVVKHTDALFALLPDFFDRDLPLRPQIAEELANFCTANHQPAFAEKAWRLLLSQPDLPKDQRTRATLRLAELEMDKTPDQAKTRLQTLAAEAEKDHRPVPADVYAILAEMNLSAKEYDLTLMNVDRALEKDRPAVFDTRTATRAWWVKAQFLYDRQHDLQAAKSTASLAGLLKTDEIYSPRALRLIITILREQHQDAQAQTEEERLRRKFPNFQNTP